MKNVAVAASSAALALAVAAPCSAFSASPLKMSLQTDSGAADTRRAFLARVGTAGAAALSTAALQGPLPALAAEDLPSTGTRAPTFELPNSREDGTTSLDDLTKSGKWTVLYFYPGAFTTGCTLEAKNFQKDIEKYRSLDTQIVGVSVDPVEKNAAFCNKEGLDFYMLTDAGGVVSKKYGSALSVPGFGTFSNRQTYIIDPKGNLRWVFTDVESRVPRHSAEVLAKLEELKA
eukprot:CAMPEP_0197444222 /NCGR_PEP_ID=MMETSP1175-20131217/9759_1 /TAXON_ID=1003142 /ORGANISM="Triceratium dubium, Strain CCMP147" /LENGTH=231 /DNA_ID=CAMNT_0042974975 /DNA_START=1 /DNA_END=696 /DNA_ORIENTATION=+